MVHKYKIYVFQILKLVIIIILNRYVYDIYFTILTYLLNIQIIININLNVY